MITDTTGIMLIPGNGGKDCPGNGEHIGENGNPIECCCDACDYLMCCDDPHWRETCGTCTDSSCPRNRL